jgi:arsenate reductase
MTSTPLKLLFLCTHNACRSILAEAICRQLAGENYIVASAGSNPAGTVFPQTLQKLKEHAYNIDGLFSKSWDALIDYQPDIVITVCNQAAGESCPVWFGKAVKGHWGLTDASKVADPIERDQTFDGLISLLESRISELLQILPARLSATELSAEIKRIGASN